MRSQECLVGSICKILASFSDLSAFQSELLRARNSEPICSAAKLAKLMFSSMVETQSAQLTSESLASKKKDRYAFPVKDDGSCQPWGSAGAMIKAFGFRSSWRIDALCIKKLMQPFACPFAVALSSSNQRKWPSWTTQIRGCLSQLIIRNIALRLLGLALRRKPRQLGGRVSKAHSTVLVTVDPEDFHSNDSNSPANTSTQNSAFYCDILMLLSLDLILLFAVDSVDLAETSGCSGLSSCRELCVLPLDIASLSRPRARGRIYTISHKYIGQWGNASTRKQPSPRLIGPIPIHLNTPSTQSPCKSRNVVPNSPRLNIFEQPDTANYRLWSGELQFTFFLHRVRDFVSKGLTAWQEVLFRSLCLLRIGEGWTEMQKCRNAQKNILQEMNWWTAESYDVRLSKEHRKARIQRNLRHGDVTCCSLIFAKEKQVQNTCQNIVFPCSRLIRESTLSSVSHSCWRQASFLASTHCHKSRSFISSCCFASTGV